jgi:hypothetical protein
VIERVARHTAMACLVIALLFAVWRRTLAAPLGVVGGGLLIGISFWAIRGSVDDLMRRQRLSGRSPEEAKADETGAKPARLALVKFFTRHAIVAVAAYGMMVRLRLDPVGLLAGVSSLGVAAGVEVLRDLRWRRFL